MNKIKLIIFDFDGVLVDAKKIHFVCLNQALVDVGCSDISWEDHINQFDGLKTYEKLNKLTNLGFLPTTLHDKVWKLKQQYTEKELSNLPSNLNLKNCLMLLKQQGYLLACATNSIKQTCLSVLTRMEVRDLFNLILTNEDVSSSKPFPEIYWNCMTTLKVLPSETLILEDSPPGLLAAQRSNSFILKINDVQEVNYNNIMTAISKLNVREQSTWFERNLNILVPMAGAGSRFEQAGYLKPKPLIDVNGRLMIDVVVQNLNINANYIFIVQSSHRFKYNLDDVLTKIAPNCKIIEVEKVTEGAACTTLLASSLINNEDSLIIANSDQFVVWDSVKFLYNAKQEDCDGSIVTFNSTEPKWSFVRSNKKTVVEVAEKKPISDEATAGIYFWKHGKDYVKYAKQMIEKNIRVNGEFYVCPVFNEAILDNKRFITFPIERMYGLGTPEDLTAFLNVNKCNES